LLTSKVLERRVRQFLFVGLSDTTEYDIVWTENGDVIDNFIDIDDQ